MKNLILTICAISMLALFAPTSYACFCSVPDLPKAYDQAIAVFAGEVVGIVPPETADDKSSLANRIYTINFKVEKTWKGVSSSSISVLSGNGKDGCLFYPAVHVGEKYLVFADSIPNEVSSRGEMVITTCNRTAKIPAEVNQTRLPSIRMEFDREDASQDLKALDPLSFVRGSGVSHHVPLNRADPKNVVNRSGCEVIDKSKSTQFISYENASETTTEITLRLHNNTSCSLIVETDDRSPTRLSKLQNSGVSVETVTSSQDGVRLPLHYLVQDRQRWRAAEPAYGWGDSVFTYELLAGQSAIFTVPLTHFRKRLDVAVPFNYAWESNRAIGMGVGGVVHRVYFLVDDVPEGVLRRKR